MKIAFSRREEKPTIGPYIFLERLITYLQKNGVEVVRNSGRFHNLYFINISGSGTSDVRSKNWTAKSILRIDGIYHDASQDAKTQNRAIEQAYHSVDGIIFQCDFARRMVYKYFGKPAKAKHEVIIPNGVDETFTPCGKAQKYEFQHNIVVSGKWSWPSKRLSEVVECFLSFDREDIGLVVLGDAPKVEHPHIKYCGFILPHKLPPYYRGADVMLHLAYTDWCPNAVVEALACGVPIITTHNGGVPEIVQGSGIIIKNEPDYNMEFVDFRNLPKISPTLVIDAINTILEDRQSFVRNRPDLSIEYCGRQYLDLFERVLND